MKLILDQLLMVLCMSMVLRSSLLGNTSSSRQQSKGSRQQRSQLSRLEQLTSMGMIIPRRRHVQKMQRISLPGEEKQRSVRMALLMVMFMASLKTMMM